MQAIYQDKHSTRGNRWPFGGPLHQSLCRPPTSPLVASRQQAWVETKSRQRAYGNLARNCRIAIGPNADDGYPVRDQGSASYIATFEPAAVFGDLVKAEGIRRGAGHVRQLTILGDGAAWIWNIATDKFPEATQIVDLFHAREHLYDLARLLEFMLLDRTDERLTARMEDLDYGDIDGICQAARLFPPRRHQERPARHRARLLREQRPPACATAGSAVTPIDICPGPRPICHGDDGRT